jgi:hypothetical protein
MARILCALVITGAIASPACAATAKRVTVTAQRYPLVCGQATGLIKVLFPAAVRVPRKIPAAAVTVNGRVASTVTVAGRTVSVIVPKKPGLTCLSIVLGKVTIKFAPRANLTVGTARTATVIHVQSYAARVAVVAG